MVINNEFIFSVYRSLFKDGPFMQRNLGILIRMDSLWIWHSTHCINNKFSFCTSIGRRCWLLNAQRRSLRFVIYVLQTEIFVWIYIVGRFFKLCFVELNKRFYWIAFQSIWEGSICVLRICLQLHLFLIEFHSGWPSHSAVKQSWLLCLSRLFNIFKNWTSLFNHAIISKSNVVSLSLSIHLKINFWLVYLIWWLWKVLSVSILSFGTGWRCGLKKELFVVDRPIRLLWLHITAYFVSFLCFDG